MLQGLPPEQRQVLERTFSALLVQGPVFNPVLNKITGAHLDKVIDGVENDNRRMYEDIDKHRSHMRFFGIVGVIAFLLVSGLFLWAKESSLLKDILTWLAIFLGGLGVGARFLRGQTED